MPAVTRLWLSLSVMAASEVAAVWLIAWSQDQVSGRLMLVEAVLGIGLVAAAASFGIVRRVAADGIRSRAAGQQSDDALRERQQFRGMTEMLQTAQTRPEVQHILTGHLTGLFPRERGAVYLFSASRDALEALVPWGGALDAGHFMPDECWALRLGKPYASDATSGSVPCLHLVDHAHPSVCVPLMANGETVGVFSVERPPEARDRPTIDGIDDLRRRASAVAERLSLPLANVLLRETLRNQSIRDPLTGAFNRRFLEESIVREIARATRQRTPLSVILVDLDHFKRVNDMFGHAVGDCLLRAVGRFFCGSLRGDDLVCRFGGEEFALVMPGASQDAAVARLEKLRSRIVEIGCDNGQGGRVSVTFSGGVATFPSDGDALDALVQAADAALYRAKAAGRDTVCRAAGPTSPSRGGEVAPGTADDSALELAESASRQVRTGTRLAGGS